VRKTVGCSLCRFFSREGDRLCDSRGSDVKRPPHFWFQAKTRLFLSSEITKQHGLKVKEAASKDKKRLAKAAATPKKSESEDRTRML
jgi:hypothetical protein